MNPLFSAPPRNRNTLTLLRSSLFLLPQHAECKPKVPSTPTPRQRLLCINQDRGRCETYKRRVNIPWPFGDSLVQRLDEKIARCSVSCLQCPFLPVAWSKKWDPKGSTNDWYGPSCGTVPVHCGTSIWLLPDSVSHPQMRGFGASAALVLGDTFSRCQANCSVQSWANHQETEAKCLHNVLLVWWNDTHTTTTTTTTNTTTTTTTTTTTKIRLPPPPRKYDYHKNHHHHHHQHQHQHQHHHHHQQQQQQHHHQHHHHHHENTTTTKTTAATKAPPPCKGLDNTKGLLCWLQASMRGAATNNSSFLTGWIDLRIRRRILWPHSKLMTPSDHYVVPGMRSCVGAAMCTLHPRWQHCRRNPIGTRTLQKAKHK